MVIVLESLIDCHLPSNVYRLFKVSLKTVRFLFSDIYTFVVILIALNNAEDIKKRLSVAGEVNLYRGFFIQKT